MTKLLIILLIPSILLGNTKSIFDDYLYNVDYLKNGNEESLENVRFISKNITSGSLRFRQIDGKKKYFHIDHKNIIRITDLQTNQVINDYYNLSIDKKSYINAMIAITVSLVLSLGVAVLIIANSSYPFQL